MMQTETGSATVPVAPVGVPPTGLRGQTPDQTALVAEASGVFGQRPKTAGETPALSNATASFQLRADR
jgi:hypothetical protein